MRSMILTATAIIRKRWNMEQTVKPHLATRTKILGFDTLLGSWFVHHAKDQQPQKQYWSELDSTCCKFVFLPMVGTRVINCWTKNRSRCGNDGAYPMLKWLGRYICPQGGRDWCTICPQSVGLYMFCKYSRKNKDLYSSSILIKYVFFK